MARLLAAAWLLASGVNGLIDVDSHHHHHHHKHHHGHHGRSSSAVNVSEAAIVEKLHDMVSEAAIVEKLHDMDKTLEQAAEAHEMMGKLVLNAPLPNDFPQRFAQAVAAATGTSAADVKVLGVVPEKGTGLDEVDFEASGGTVAAVAAQAADPTSKLANGVLHTLLVARETEDADDQEGVVGSPAAAPAASPAAAPVPVPAPQGRPAEVDMHMPFGGLEPFGREDTAQDLTDASIRESDAMVDQVERAEVAEEKRAVFRALTRLRGAAISSFDGVARAHTGNVDEFSRKHQWRKLHPIRHLASEESDVSRWAFPNDSK